MLDYSRLTSSPQSYPGPEGRIPLNLPDGIVVREDAHPGAVDLPRLLDDLSSTSFSGMLMAATPSSGSAALVFYEGRTAHAELGNGRPTLGGDALAQLLRISRAEPIRLDLRRFTDRFVVSFLALISGEPYPRPINLSNLSVAKDESSLRRERFTGSIHVRSADAAREGFLFYAEGWPIQSYVRQGSALARGNLPLYQIAGEAGGVVRAFRSPTPGQIELGTIVRRLIDPPLEPLIACVERVVQALSEVAGPVKARRLFLNAQLRAGEQDPWIQGLALTEQGTIEVGRAEFDPKTVSRAVPGFLALLDHCWSQARDVFGARVVRPPIEARLRALRPRLALLGLSESWPEA